MDRALDAKRKKRKSLVSSGLGNGVGIYESSMKWDL